MFRQLKYLISWTLLVTEQGHNPLTLDLLPERILERESDVEHV